MPSLPWVAFPHSALAESPCHGLGDALNASQGEGNHIFTWKLCWAVISASPCISSGAPFPHALFQSSPAGRTQPWGWGFTSTLPCWVYTGDCRSALSSENVPLRAQKEYKYKCVFTDPAFEANERACQHLSVRGSGAKPGFQYVVSGSWGSVYVEQSGDCTTGLEVSDCTRLPERGKRLEGRAFLLGSCLGNQNLGQRHRFHRFQILC